MVMYRNSFVCPIMTNNSLYKLKTLFNREPAVLNLNTMYKFHRLQNVYLLGKSLKLECGQIDRRANRQAGIETNCCRTHFILRWKVLKLVWKQPNSVGTTPSDNKKESQNFCSIILLSRVQLIVRYSKFYQYHSCQLAILTLTFFWNIRSAWEIWY